MQTCIVHLIRNSMDFASWKDRKPIAAELKATYRATDADVARGALSRTSTPASGAANIRRSRRAGGETGSMSSRCSRLFVAVRRIIYITNAMKSLNAKLRRAVRTRGHFSTDEAAIKLCVCVLRQVGAGARGNAATRMARG